MLRHRRVVLLVWAVVFVASGIASSGLAGLLTNRFTLPGTDTHTAELILEDHFGQRSTGSFTIVAQGTGNANASTLVPRVRAAARRAVGELPTGRLVATARR